MERVRPRLTHVAERAGVSPATVSRALSRPNLVNAGTLERVQRAAAALGYVPGGAARALVSGRTMTIGAVVPTLDHSIFAQAIQALQSVLLANNYQLLLASHDYSAATEAAACRAMLARGVDGLVLVGADHLPETWALLEHAGMPVLLTWSRDVRLPSLWFDNQRAGRLAAEHLLGLGHTAFGMVSGVLRWNDRARMRVEGVRSALAGAGLELPGWRVMEAPFSLAGGRAGMARLLAEAAPPTAVVCGNDLLAVGALMELQSRGLQAPEDVSVVGIDDLEIAAHFAPALTTVHLPTAELGARAGEMLIAMLLRRPVRRETELPIELVVRRSSGPVRRSPRHSGRAPSGSG